MRHSIAAVILVAMVTAASAQAPPHHWTRVLGGHNNDFTDAIAVDSGGNIILAGTFNDTINFGGSDLIANSIDMYLAKFDRYGSHLWSQNFEAGEAYAIAIDYNDDIIVAGDLAGTTNFGGGNLVSTGIYDIFLARFDSDGVHQWSQNFGGNSLNGGRDVAVDNGDIAMTGYFRGTADFGGGNLVSAGKNDIFVAKFDINGVHLWSQRFGDAEDDQGYAVAIDGSGNVVVGGTFQLMTSFGGGTLTSLGGYDLFLAKFQPSGFHSWSQSFGSTANDLARGLAVDATNNIVLVGDYSQTIDLGGGGLVSAGSSDIFAARYTPQGTHLWSQRYGGASQDRCRALALDDDGDIVITGEYYGAFDFGGGNNLPSPDSTSNAYVAEFDEDGGHIWSEGFADGVQSLGRDVATDGTSIVLLGAFKSFLDIRGDIYVGDADSTIWDGFVSRFAGEGVDPFISSITDVPNDQGRWVEIEFLHSTNDAVGSVTPILGYEVYRRDGIYGAAAATRPSGTAAAEGWTYVGSTPAHGDYTYSVIAPTVADSTISMGAYNSTFFVRAATGVPTIYFDSLPDSGYSLDNLSPAAPSSFTINAGTLAWDESEAADFDHYAVYGAGVDDFGAAVLIGYTTALDLDVTGSPYPYYFVTATDESGNEGDPASLSTVTGVSDTPRRYVLSVSNYPNPFNPATVIRYTVPSAGPVSITVFDARGSHVASLVDDRAHAAGAYTVEWRGLDDAGTRVASGVYFARIRHGGAVKARKMILLK